MLCPALAHLDLDYNAIRAAGAESLAGVLGQCTALPHLNLNDNGIGASGATSLAGVLGQCTTLAHLDLSGNLFQAVAAERLAGVLGQCTALADLSLCKNGIDDSGSESLAGVPGSALRWSTSISVAMKSAPSGTEGFELRVVVKPLVLFWRTRTRASRWRRTRICRCSARDTREEEEEDPALLPEELAQLLRRH